MSGKVKTRKKGWWMCQRCKRMMKQWTIWHGKRICPACANEVDA